NDISWLLAEETDEPLVRTVKPRVTVLTPVYNEEANLARYERQVTRVLLAHPDHEFEFLLIDDGSTDRSWALIQELCARNSRFQGLRLSRNFGAHVALCAGFAHAEGEAVVTLACDLQDPPQVVLQFLTEWRAGAQIVWGHRRTRQDESWRVVASRLFRGLLQRHALPRGSRFTTGSFFLVDKKVAECYREFQEANRITFALIAWTGFTQAVVEYDRLARTAGQTGWTFGKMMKAMYDAFLGFSPLPI